jgi:hypothetical protein
MVYDLNSPPQPFPGGVETFRFEAGKPDPFPCPKGSRVTVVYDAKGNKIDEITE